MVRNGNTHFIVRTSKCQISAFTLSMASPSSKYSRSTKGENPRQLILCRRRSDRLHVMETSTSLLFCSVRLGSRKDNNYRQEYLGRCNPLSGCVNSCCSGGLGPRHQQHEGLGKRQLAIEQNRQARAGTGIIITNSAKRRAELRPSP